MPRVSRTFQFIPGSLITLPEAEHTDNSDSDENEENAHSISSSSIMMEGGPQTPPPEHPQKQQSSDVMTTPEDGYSFSKLNHHQQQHPTKGGDGSSFGNDAPRVGLSPGATQPSVHADVRRTCTSANTPTPTTNNVVVERESSRLQETENGGVESSSSSCRRNKDENDSKASTAAATNNNKEEHRDHNNNTNTTSTTMDDDSLGLRSAAGSPQSQREPEGSVPSHRIGQSRRFSDDLQAIIQKELEDEEVNGGTVATSNGDTPPPTSPPGLKEISISKTLEGAEDESSDDVSAPSTSPPVGSTTPPPAPLKVKQHLEEEEEEEDVPLKQPEQPRPEDDTWNQPMDNSFEGGYPPNAPYKTDPSLRPPSITDQAPQESDLSVFSIHSGYAMHDPNGLPPRIVPGMMVTSPPPYSSHPYANIPSHIHHQSPGYTQHPQHYAQQAHQQSYPVPSPVIMAPPPPASGKRKIHFRLVEDVPTPASTRKGMRGGFLSFRRNSSRASLLTPSPVEEEPPQEMERGRVTVSWYEGTTTLELMEHVRNAVIRKLGIQGTTKLAELRILDEGSVPPEEIVLTPYIPSGSKLLLRFTTRDAGGYSTPPYGRQRSYTGGAPDSPSAAPSPHASALDLEGLGLNPNQLALLGTRLKGLQMPMPDGRTIEKPRDTKKKSSRGGSLTPSKKSTRVVSPRRSKSDRDQGSDEEYKEEDAQSSRDDQSSVFETQSLHPEDPIQKSLQNITELLMLERQKQALYYPKQEKRQVVFTLANYFVLFLSLIAISAEIQARAPEWNAAIERHLASVVNCSKDQDALFECVSNGDFSGLVASVVLWISRSAATKRIFLLGFESPRKLWTVVYESLVTSVCWGFSYMFIRRGMNPDTNRNFLQKYWKDAVYGSLAGFNAAFMKHVMKNLIPQEAIEDALQDRQLKILSWLPSLNH